MAASEADPTQLDASNARLLDEIFEGADFGLAVWDRDLRFLRVNQALARINGRPVAEHIGRSLEEVLPETAGPVGRGLRALFARDAEPISRIEVFGPGTAGRRYEYVLHALRDGEEVVGAWAAVWEITEAYRDHKRRRELVDELEDEHRITTQLQVSLLPDVLPSVPGADIASAFHPAGDGHEIGGDFLDVFRVGRPQCWMVVIGDVCGKGAEAAALTALARYTLRASAIREGAEPSTLLTQLNEAIRRQHSDLRYLTAVCAFLEPADSGLRLTVCVAGHPPPLRIGVDDEVEEVGGSGGLLGVWDSPGLSESVVELAPGDRLVLYTDGVSEAGAPATELGGAGVARAAVGAGGEATAAETIAAIERAVDPSGSAALRDDMAMLVVRPEPR